jgi:hypothetical protein
MGNSAGSIAPWIRTTDPGLFGLDYLLNGSCRESAKADFAPEFSARIGDPGYPPQVGGDGVASAETLPWFQPPGPMRMVSITRSHWPFEHRLKLVIQCLVPVVLFLVQDLCRDSRNICLRNRERSIHSLPLEAIRSFEFVCHQVRRDTLCLLYQRSNR